MSLQSPVNDLAVESAFNIVDDMLFLEERRNIKSFKLLVGYRGNGCIEFFSGEFIDNIYAVFTLSDGGVGPGIINGDVDIVFFQGFVDVYNLGVANIGAVLLESETENEDMAVKYLYTFLQHQLDGLRSDMFTHAIVHTTTGKNDFGVVAIAFSTLGEIVGIHTYAMATNKTGTEGEEVPLGASSFKYVEGVDAHLVENLGELVNESDVDVALGVLNDLGGLSDLNGRSEVCTGGDDGGIDLIDIFADFRGGARSDFFDVLHGVLLVTGIDALGRIAAIEIDIHLHTADLLYDGDAVVLGDTGIDGGLIDYDIAFADDFTYGGAGTDEGSEVGVVVCIDRSGNGNDIEVAVLDFLNVGGADKTVILNGVLKDVVGYFKRCIVTCHKSLTALGIHVETYGLIFCAEKTGEGKTDVTQADDTDFCLFHCWKN